MLRWYRHVMKNMSFCNFIGLTAIFSLKARRRMLLAISSGSIPVPGRLLLFASDIPNTPPCFYFQSTGERGASSTFLHNLDNPDTF